MPKKPNKSRAKRATAVSDRAALQELLERGVIDVIPRRLLEMKLTDGERIRVYLGVDPTGPDIHLGHAVILRKLRALQELGHEVILLLGDFTARIGDPTDRAAARTALTHEEVLANAKSYKAQAAKILDFSSVSPNPARLEFNAKWLDKLKFQDVIELAARFTVQQMLERDMYQQRLKDAKPIYVHEFLYPIMQGYDSVAMDVDMEVGGNDQLFNMLTGRTLQKEINQREKIVMTFELLPGLDGRKMSKSYGNVVGVADAPNEMFGKIMSLADELIPQYFLLCTDATQAEVKEISEKLAAGENPRDWKIALAKRIVGFYHSEQLAEAAAAEFVQVFREKKKPTEIAEYTMGKNDLTFVDLLVNAGAAKSKGAARRLLEQNGVRLNDKKVSLKDAFEVSDGDIVQVGKRAFLKIRK
jgi:tyrosyl-tRNA synthetase